MSNTTFKVGDFVKFHRLYGSSTNLKIAYGFITKVNDSDMFPPYFEVKWNDKNIFHISNIPYFTSSELVKV